MPLSFRPAAGRDAGLIRALAERIWRESYAAMLSVAQIDYMLAWMYDSAKLAAEMEAGVIWELAALDATPIGYLSLTIHDSRMAELNKLYLLPACQGQGLGQAMLSRVQAIGRAHSCTTLRLRVNKTNERALRAYDRAGFHIVDALVADIGGGFVMNDYVLARPIEPAV